MIQKTSNSLYNPRTILMLLLIFILIFSLLYAIASFWYESRRINAEIESIETENKKNIAAIQEKKERLEYLQTAERIEKEAKIETRRKRANEKVIVFIAPETQFQKKPVTWDDRKSFEENIVQYETKLQKNPSEEWITLFFGTPDITNIREVPLSTEL